MKLNDEQIEYVTEVMYSTIMDISNETGFIPEHEDIIKCLDYALKSLWFFPLAIYIHCGIVGSMKDSTPSLFIKDYMTLKFDTTHEYYMESMNVGYIESMNCLFVQDTDENTININGVDADDMIRLARNMFCAKQKAWDYVKDSQKDHVNDQLQEIYDSLTDYFAEKQADQLEQSISVK